MEISWIMHSRALVIQNLHVDAGLLINLDYSKVLKSVCLL